MWVTIALALLAQTSAEPTRMDLGRAYMRFERALTRHPFADDRVAEVNRSFDALTLDFFMGRGKPAIEKLEALTSSLLEEADPRDYDRLDFALEATRESNGRVRVSLHPSAIVGIDTDAMSARIECRSWSIGDGLFRELEVDVESIMRDLTRPSSGRRRAAEIDEVERLERCLDLDLACPPRLLDVQRQHAWFVEFAGRRHRACNPFFETPALAARRDEIAGILQQIEPDGPPLEQALASCRARAELLKAPAQSSSTYLIGRDVHALAADVHREAHALARGEDPYRRRRGDTWRVVHLKSGDLPVRVYAPIEGSLEHPLPLVVLFHGMGGDENMFFDGYGAGRITHLAEENRFLCVAPLGGFKAMTPEAFDQLLDAVRYDYAVDAKRIYLVGHSMGAGAAYSLGVARADCLAAVACIAGGVNGATPKSIAPLLVVTGELDALVSPKSLRVGCERLKTAGFPVEFQAVPNQGHTLVVGDKLPAVVGWLLTHSR